MRHNRLRPRLFLIEHLEGRQLLAGNPIVYQPAPTDVKEIWTTSVYSYTSDGDPYPGGGLENDQLRVGGWGDEYDSLVQFNLATLPRTASSAVLRLFDADANGGTPVGMYLDRITQPWDWRTMGTGRDRERLWWADRPATTPAITDPLTAPTPDSWYEIDITQLYNDWKSGAVPNYGLELRPTGNANEFNLFHSSNYATDPTLRPELVVSGTPSVAATGLHVFSASQDVTGQTVQPRKPLRLVLSLSNPTSTAVRTVTHLGISNSNGEGGLDFTPIAKAVPAHRTVAITFRFTPRATGTFTGSFTLQSLTRGGYTTSDSATGLPIVTVQSNTPPPNVTTPPAAAAHYDAAVQAAQAHPKPRVPNLPDFIARGEGVVRFVYPDPDQIPTIGFGFNLTNAGAQSTIDSLLGRGKFAALIAGFQATEAAWTAEFGRDAASDPTFQYGSARWDTFAQQHSQDLLAPQISRQNATQLLSRILPQYQRDAKSLLPATVYNKLSAGARLALTDITYNRGLGNVQTFMQPMLDDLTSRDYAMAAWDLMNSMTRDGHVWADVVHMRSEDDLIYLVWGHENELVRFM